MQTQTTHILTVLVPMRNELERLERELGELPPDIEKALQHINLFLFDHDSRKAAELFQDFLCMTGFKSVGGVHERAR